MELLEAAINPRLATMGKVLATRFDLKDKVLMPVLSIPEVFNRLKDCDFGTITRFDLLRAIAPEYKKSLLNPVAEHGYPRTQVLTCVHKIQDQIAKERFLNESGSGV